MKQTKYGPETEHNMIGVPQIWAKVSGCNAASSIRVFFTADDMRVSHSGGAGLVGISRTLKGQDRFLA